MNKLFFQVNDGYILLRFFENGIVLRGEFKEYHPGFIYGSPEDSLSLIRDVYNDYNSKNRDASFNMKNHQNFNLGYYSITKDDVFNMSISMRQSINIVEKRLSTYEDENGEIVSGMKDIYTSQLDSVLTNRIYTGFMLKDIIKVFYKSRAIIDSIKKNQIHSDTFYYLGDYTNDGYLLNESLNHTSHEDGLPF